MQNEKIPNIEQITGNLTDWEKEPTVADLTQNITDAANDYDRHISDIKNWISNMFVEDVKTTGTQSTVTPKLIRKQAEWRYASLTEPFLSTPDLFNVSPITAGDKNRAKQNELVLNNQFNTKLQKVKFIDSYVRDAVDLGTTIVKVGWDSEEETITKEVPTYDYIPNDIPEQIQEYQMLLQMQQQKPEMYMDYSTPGLDNALDIFKKTGKAFIPKETGVELVTETVETKNQPTLNVYNHENLIIDPSCNGDPTKAGFMCEKFKTSLSELKKDGKYTNLDKINIEGASPLASSDYTEGVDNESFNFVDKARKQFVVHTYWGYWDIDGSGIAQAIVASWVGDVLIRLEENPYPDKRPPFVVVAYMPVRDSIFGEPDGELLESNQKIIGAVTRGMLDLLGKSANGQTGIRRDMLDTTNKRKFQRGDDYEFNATVDPRQGFFTHVYPEIPQSAYNMLNIQNAEAESLTGIKAFNSGISGQALGNMLDINTEVPLFDGNFKALVDIQDGDIIVGSNGKGITVTKAHDVKYPEIAYDMSFDNGSVVKSGGEHLWTVKVHGTNHALRKWTTLTADEIYAHMQQGRRITLPKIQEIDSCNEVPYAIDPYVFGYWLGDGCLHSARITTCDIEVLGFFTEAGYTCKEVKKSNSGAALTYDVYKTGHATKRCEITGCFTGNKSLHSELKALNVHGRYGGIKHIPEAYFTATYAIKMELLRGLMDSDGYAHSNAFVQLAQSESVLQKDIIRLLKSLGLKVSIRVKTVAQMNKQKLAHSTRTGAPMIWARKAAYEMGFTPWSNPFKLTRKKDKWQLPHKHTSTLKSMHIVDTVPMRCLTVDSADKLYAVTRDYTLTHNTATGIRSALDASSKRELSILLRLAEGMVEIGHKIISMNAVFLSEEEIVRITDDNFIQIRRDDLAGHFDLRLSISTAEEDNKKAEELAFMLQTTGPNSDPGEVRMIRAEIARLRKMPDLALKIEEYQPEPDPMAQMEMELKLKLLQAQIAKEEAAAQKNMAAAQLDMARVNKETSQAELNLTKTGTEKAKARNLSSLSDKQDLDFVEQESGVNQERQLEQLSTKHNHKRVEQNDTADANMIAKLTEKSMETPANK